MNVRILNLVAYLSDNFDIETSIHFNKELGQFYIDMNTQTSKPLYVYFGDVFSEMIYFVCGEHKFEINEYNLFYTNMTIQQHIFDNVMVSLENEETYNKSYDKLINKFK